MKVRAWAWLVMPAFLVGACAISPRTVEELPEVTDSSGGGSPTTMGGTASLPSKGGALPKPLGGAGAGATNPDDDCAAGDLDPSWAAIGAGGAGPCTAASLDRDPNNCGACGHACGHASTCNGGLCTPVTVVEAQTKVLGTYLRSGELYWSDRSGLRLSKVTLSNGQISHLVCLETEASLLIAQVVADDENVWFASDGDSALYRVSIDGGVPMPVFRRDSGISGIAVDESSVYVANPLVNDIRVVDKSTVQQRVINTGYGVSRIAVDATNLYWIESGALRQARKTVDPSGAAGTIVTLASDQIDDIAIDDEYVYWNDGNLVRVLKSAGPASVPEVVAFTGVGQGLAIDDSSAYWASAFGEIFKIPKAGGVQTMLTHSDASAFVVAVDDKYVYWSESSNNDQRIRRVAK